MDPLEGLALTDDRLLGGRVVLAQPARGYRAAIDPVLLAASVPAIAGQRVLDLCCGVGTVGVCLAARVSAIRVVGVEIEPALAALARRNGAANGLGDRHVVIEADATRLDPGLGAFDRVALNPPWHDASHPPSPDPRKARANRAADDLLERLVDAAIRRLKPGGTLAIIHRADALPTLLAALDARVGALEAHPIATLEGQPASRVILRAIKGRRTPFVLRPALEPADWKPALEAPIALPGSG